MIGRDVRDADLLRVQEVLASWVARSGSLVKLIEEKITLARSEIKVRKKAKKGKSLLKTHVLLGCASGARRV